MSLPQEQLAVQTHQRLHTEFQFYARHCLWVKDKDGNIVPFEFNTAQEILDAVVCEQLAEHGWVRLIVVKGRQQGCSTYIEGRFFWHATLKPGITVSILSHERAATEALFDKVDLFYRRCPDQLKPKQRISNTNELILENESDYIVSTAGTKNTGRSRTAQRQHRSEEAFMDNIQDINAGIGQIVAMNKGTEVFKESTGNGKNHFWRDVDQALQGNGNFRVVFIPPFLQKEYRAKVKPGFVPDDYEQSLKDNYTKEKVHEQLSKYYSKAILDKVLRDFNGIDNEYLQWRRDVIADTLKDERLFKQEYPHTLEEAFQESGDPFIESDLIERARKFRVDNPQGPVIIGCDPAGDGKNADRTVIAFRQGNKFSDLIKYSSMDEVRLAGILAKLIDEKAVDKVFIDHAYGRTTINLLKERGYGHIIEGVNFGGGADDPTFLNKRAEMMFHLRDWLKEGGCDIPDDDDMAADIASMPQPTFTGAGKIKFIEKKEIKTAIGRSPDILDAMMLTFAYAVRATSDLAAKTMQRVANSKGGSALTTLSRIRQNDEDRRSSAGSDTTNNIKRYKRDIR